MNTLPALTTVATDVSALLSTIETQKAESKLFQFLNGLDDYYAAIRSQLLMQNPIPTVEMAYAAVQQEKNQKDVQDTSTIELTSMYGHNTAEHKNFLCTTCGGRGHSGKKCCSVVGYPIWHHKYKKTTQKGTQFVNRWKNTRGEHSKMDNIVTHVLGSPEVSLTPQQLQLLLKMLPVSSSKSKGSDIEEELENCFSGMVTCQGSKAAKGIHEPWIIDSGASDHMSSTLVNMTNIKLASSGIMIKLPTGGTSKITHIGDFKLHNGLLLKMVLCVPEFEHNLLSIHKWSSDNLCVVKFAPHSCQIIDSTSNAILAIGHVHNGLFYLNNVVASQPITISSSIHSTVHSKESFSLCHNRLGHAPLARLKHLSFLKNVGFPSTQICITCPTSKFSKMPYNLSSSHAATLFELVHVDTWRPYRVQTREKYKYFLTVVGFL